MTITDKSLRRRIIAALMLEAGFSKQETDDALAGVGLGE